jgi:predicted transposase YdaD
MTERSALKDAMKEGEAKGEAKGKAEGKIEGKAEEKIDIALKMLADRIPIDTVCKYNALSKQQIEEILK